MAKLQKLTGILDIIVVVRKICSIAYPPLTLVFLHLVPVWQSDHPAAYLCIVSDLNPHSKFSLI